MPRSAAAMKRVVIIGGGVMGSSTASFLAAHPDFAGTITVVERDPTYARASSALSASSIRQQFTTPVNIALSLFGIDFLRGAETSLAVNGDRPGLGLREPGYLFLATAAGEAGMRARHAVQRAHGADVALLGTTELAARFPWMDTTGATLGSLGLTGEGWFDGPALLQAFRRMARARGVVYRTGEAVALEDDGRLVRLADGDVLAADAVVIAAGGWSAPIAGTVGFALPIRPRRRMVFVIDTPAKLPGCPLLIDPSGVWLRPEGDRFLCGRSPGPGEDDPDEPPLVVEDAMFEERIWPVIAARVPGLETLRVTASWAGYYEMNLFDHNGVVGRLPVMGEVYVAAGFSGHGMQHAPGIGRGMAELIATGRFRTLDLSALGPARISAGRPLMEDAVV